VDEYLSIRVEATTLLPLVSGEIKSREVREGEHRIKPARITGDGKVAVPIYGALRAYLEKTLRENGEQVCDTGLPGKEGQGCGKCVLCDLFGYLGKRGRAIIDDLKSEKPYREVVARATHLKIDREKGAVNATLKMEEIVEGTKFVGYIRIIDPKPRDVELILTGLKAIEEFGLGGWLTRGRGRVKIGYAIEKKRWSDFVKKAREELKGIT